MRICQTPEVYGRIVKFADYKRTNIIKCIIQQIKKGVYCNQWRSFRLTKPLNSRVIINRMFKCELLQVLVNFKPGGLEIFWNIVKSVFYNVSKLNDHAGRIYFKHNSARFSMLFPRLINHTTPNGIKVKVKVYFTMALLKFKEFLEDGQIKPHLKADFNVPTKVWQPEDVNFPFIEREDVIGPTLKMMEKKWKRGHSLEKQSNPLIGFHSVPGGGKSFLVDTFVRMNLDDGKSVNMYVHFTITCKESVMKRFGGKLGDPDWFAKEFVNSIKIAITFNRQMTVSFFPDPRQDLHSRLLYS